MNIVGLDRDLSYFGLQQRLVELVAESINGEENLQK